MSYIISDDFNIKNYKSLTKTNATSVSTTTSYADIAGSDISYTPSDNASKVIYEYIFQATKPDSGIGAITYFQFLEDTGSGFSSKGNEYKSMLTFSNNRGEETVRIRYVLDSWSGERSFKLQVKGYSGSYLCNLNVNYDNEVYYPTVTMFSAE